MFKYLMVVLAVAGSYYYLTRHLDMEKGLNYAVEHKSASWSPRARYTIGLVYYQREQYGKAQEVFSEFLTDYSTGPFTARGLFYLEDSAENTHDWLAARSALDRYLSEFPEGEDIQLMRQRRELLRYHHGL